LGLDIGAGASAIYPLLAIRQNPNWRFLCTEIDDLNREYATKNIEQNNLQNRIRIIDTDPTSGRIIPTLQLSNFERIDVLITNPPFYSSSEEMLQTAKNKSRPPGSSCTGAEIEMITPGGEVSFVSQIITESSSPALRKKIQWFSAMLGKLSSVGTIVEVLRERKCNNCAVKEFVQGSRTRRWCVAWSWQGYRPDGRTARGVGIGSGVEKKFLPPVNESDFDVEGEEEDDDDDIGKRISQEIGKLCEEQSDDENMKWRFDTAKGIGMFMSREGDVWSRKARRKKRAGEISETKHAPGKEVNGNSNKQKDTDTEMIDGHGEEAEDDSEDEAEPALVVRITVEAKTRGIGIMVHMRHLQGHDSVLFESFCGWLKRKVVPP
jgi:23S rRNA (adenine1618-N6)-methyltransferase